jgi:hypothetical protein
MRVGFGHATACMWSPAAGSGVFLYELVPSEDPFIPGMASLRNNLFRAAIFFPQRPFLFISSEK